MPIRCLTTAVRAGCARALVAALLLIGPVTLAAAQDPSTGSGQGYPTRPVRLIVASSPGAGVDMIIAKLNSALVNVLRERELLDKIAAEGAEPAPGRPDDFARLVSSELTMWGKVIKASGL